MGKSLIFLLAVSFVVSFVSCESREPHGRPSYSSNTGWETPPLPTYRVEKRGGKYGLWRNDSQLVFDFQYDSVRLGRWPIAIRGNKKYAVVCDNENVIVGPFDEIYPADGDKLKVFGRDRSGVVYTQDVVRPHSRSIIFPRRYSEITNLDRDNLYMVKEGDKTGIIRVDGIYRNYERIGQKFYELLPLAEYFYVDWSIVCQNPLLVEIKFFKKDGHYVYSIFSDDERRVVAKKDLAKEKKFELEANIGNKMLVVSQKGRYGLINDQCEVIVPPEYSSYRLQENTCIFVSSLHGQFIVPR